MEEPAVRGCPGSVEPIGLLTVLKELMGPAGDRSLGAAKDCTRCGLLEESLVGAVATEKQQQQSLIYGYTTNPHGRQRGERSKLATATTPQGSSGAISATISHCEGLNWSPPKSHNKVRVFGILGSDTKEEH